jgi:hypothetical protein
MVVVMPAISRWRTTKLVQGPAQLCVDLCHGCYRCLEMRGEIGLLFLGHQSPPAVKFFDMALIVVDPMLQEYAEFFGVIHGW